jgi:hypothetical protein
MDKVTLVKQEIAATQWAEQISLCRNSGLSVTSWCRENGINPKTYYYHLRKLREKACEQIPVPMVSIPACTGQSDSVPLAAITVRDASGLTVGISDGTSAQTIAAVIRALKC